MFGFIKKRFFKRFNKEGEKTFALPPVLGKVIKKLAFNVEK